MPIDYPENINIQDVNDEIWFDIINRTITPKNGQMSEDILVQNDANSRNLGFMIQRYFEGEDLSKKRIRVHYVNSLNQHDIASTHSIKVVGDEEDVVSFQWLISDKVCAEGGNVQFAIEFYNDNEKYRLFTKPTTIGIVKGICTVGEFIEPESDWFKEYSARMNILETYIDSFNKAVENGEFDGAYALNTFANAVKGNESGEVVRIDDVSPVEHTMGVQVHSKNLFDISKITTQTSSNNITVQKTDENVITITTPEGYAGTGYVTISQTLKDVCPQLQAGKTYVLSAVTDSVLKVFHFSITGGSTYWSFGEKKIVTEAMLNAHITIYGLTANKGQGVGDCKISNIQIEEGETVTEYTPYVDPTTAKVIRCGKNLITTNEIEVKKNDAWSRVSVAQIKVPSGNYVASCYFKQVGTDKAKTAISIRDYNDHLTILATSVSTETTDKLVLPFTINEGQEGFQLYLYSNYSADILSTDCICTNIMVEAGEIATEFEEYKGETYTPNADGSVSGVTSLFSTTTLFTDTADTTIHCEYNKDSNKVVQDLLNRITPPSRLDEVTILASAWVGSDNLYSQVVNINGITEYSKVDLLPSVEQLSIFHNKDLAFVTENEDGVVTVYSIGDKPTNDYTMQVSITEVVV